MSSKMSRQNRRIIEANRNTVLELFQNRCAMNRALPADTVHEIEPRSQRPTDWWELENMIPLSNFWHTRIHNEGAATYKEILKEKRKSIANT